MKKTKFIVAILLIVCSLVALVACGEEGGDEANYQITKEELNIDGLVDAFFDFLDVYNETGSTKFTFNGATVDLADGVRVNKYGQELVMVSKCGRTTKIEYDKQYDKQTIYYYEIDGVEYNCVLVDGVWTETRLGDDNSYGVPANPSIGNALASIVSMLENRNEVVEYLFELYGEETFENIADKDYWKLVLNAIFDMFVFDSQNNAYVIGFDEIEQGEISKVEIYFENKQFKKVVSYMGEYTVESMFYRGEEIVLPNVA